MSALPTLPATDLSPVPASTPTDGVEILVHLAKTGQIDPWNINIAQVADQYLQAVSEIKASDLRVTGKTLLFLAILLRMKSDQLAGINYLDPPIEAEFPEDYLDSDLEQEEESARIPRTSFQSLEEVIARRTSAKQHRIRQVTLNDLIFELKRYEELEKARALKEKVEKADRRRMRDYSALTVDEIENLAHEEFLEETILSLKEVLEEILIHQQQISLSDLVRRGKIDKISAFLALLFLEARGEVAMAQEEFYAEVYVGRE